ncbi:hypothetical protein QFZ77_004384 [Paenibacillus sp. V4I3]|nr:hypothetical protein [Paenibacillus sp. V4I3]
MRLFLIFVPRLRIIVLPEIVYVPVPLLEVDEWVPDTVTSRLAMHICNSLLSRNKLMYPFKAHKLINKL